MEECPISLKKLKRGKDRYGLTKTIYLNCNENGIYHCFRRDALKRWVLLNPTEIPKCPVCRKHFDPLQVFI